MKKLIVVMLVFIFVSCSNRVDENNVNDKDNADQLISSDITEISLADLSNIYNDIFTDNVVNIVGNQSDINYIPLDFFSLSELPEWISFHQHTPSVFIYSKEHFENPEWDVDWYQQLNETIPPFFEIDSEIALILKNNIPYIIINVEENEITDVLQSIINNQSLYEQSVPVYFLDGDFVGLDESIEVVGKNYNIKIKQDISKIVAKLNNKEQISYEEFQKVLNNYYSEKNFFIAGDREGMDYLDKYIRSGGKSDLPYWLARMKDVQLFLSNQEIEYGYQVNSLLLNTNNHFNNPAWWDWYDVLELNIPFFFSLDSGYHLIVNGSQLIVYLNINHDDYAKYIDNLFEQGNPLKVQFTVSYTDDASEINPINNVLVYNEVKKDIFEIIDPSVLLSENSIELKDGILIGSRETVEAFDLSFELKDFSYQSRVYVSNEEIDYAKTIVSLVSEKDQFHRHINEIIPEVVNMKTGEYISKKINGKHYVVVYGKNEQDLQKIISKLPTSIMNEELRNTIDTTNILSPDEKKIKEWVDAGTDFSNTDYGRIIYVEANPEKGFNFPYLIQIPTSIYKNINNNKYMVFEMNNIRPNYDFNKTIIETYEWINEEWRVMYHVSDELHLPRVMPITPRPNVINNSGKVIEYIKPQGLDSTTMTLEKDYLKMEISENDFYDYDDLKLLFNFEDQMVNIINDAKERLINAGYNMEDKIYLGGFSTGGSFSNRFSAIYPEIIQAAYIGGMHHPILPSNVYNGKDLIYPVGVSDFNDIFNKSFNKEVYNNLPKLFHLGEGDTNDPLWGYDTYTEEERQLLISLIGKDMPSKWYNIIDLYYELGGTGQFITHKGLEHSYDEFDVKYIVEFFRQNNDSFEAVYENKYNSKSVIIRNH